MFKVQRSQVHIESSNPLTHGDKGIEGLRISELETTGKKNDKMGRKGDNSIEVMVMEILLLKIFI